MGIKDINKVIGKYSNMVSLKNYANKKVGIDVNNFMYRFLRSPAYANHAYPILKGFSNQIATFQRFNITPIYVFEGRASGAKADTLQKRKDYSDHVKNKIALLQKEILRRNNAEGAIGEDNEVVIEELNDGVVGVMDGVDGIETIQLLPDGKVVDIDAIDLNVLDELNIDIAELSEMGVEEMQEKINALTVQTLVPTYKDNKMCKKLFTYTNVKYICAPGEADEILATLNHKKEIDAVLTADMDLLAYGTTVLLADIKTSKEGPVFKEYILSNILHDMGWTFDQFVDFCILSGCDYVDRIKWLGVKTAKDFIDTHFTIENVVAAIQRKKKTKMVVDDDYLEKVKIARKMFNLNTLNKSIPSIPHLNVTSIEGNVDINIVDISGNIDVSILNGNVDVNIVSVNGNGNGNNNNNEGEKMRKVMKHVSNIDLTRAENNYSTTFDEEKVIPFFTKHELSQAILKRNKANDTKEPQSKRKKTDKSQSSITKFFN